MSLELGLLSMHLRWSAVQMMKWLKVIFGWKKEIFSKKGHWKIRLAKFQRNDLWSPQTQDQVSPHADVQCLAICFIWENDFPLLPGVGDGVALCTHTCGLLLISDGTAACNGKINRLAYHAFYREHLPSLSLLYYKSAGCLFFQTRCVRHDRMDSLRICPTFSSSFFLPFSFFFAFVLFLLPFSSFPSSSFLSSYSSGSSPSFLLLTRIMFWFLMH